MKSRVIGYSKMHCPNFNRHRPYFDGKLFLILLFRVSDLFYFSQDYLANYVAKRYLKIYKDPFAEYFLRGCRCWIPLNVIDDVGFVFIEKEAEQIEMEIAHINDTLI